MPTTGERFEQVVAIMARLRGEGGCPWDREQTFDSIKPYTLEETYEVLEAIDKRDWEELPAELGDLLLQVLFYAQMAKDDGRFAIDDVLDRLASKLIGRHPHVFGDVKAENSTEVLRNWEAIKAQEKKQRAGDEKKATTLSGVSTAMPALMEAHKISSRAARVGFDWPDIDGIFDKLVEETQELREHLKEHPRLGPAPVERSSSEVPQELRDGMEEELGDLFFVLVNLARFLALDSESALRKTNRKFRRRFDWIEAQLASAGRSIDKTPMQELEALWQRSKQEGL